MVAQSPEPGAHVLNARAFRIELEFRNVVFAENRSTRRKTSRSREENQQQTQPTYDVESGNRTRVTLVEGECSHHSAIPAPPNVFPTILSTAFKKTPWRDGRLPLSSVFYCSSPILNVDTPYTRCC